MRGYVNINKKKNKIKFQLPRIQETLNLTWGAKYFTRLDLRSAYNLIRIKEGDEWKTAFQTRYGLYELLVMPFGQTNAPATCQRFVNDTLREYLDVFCVYYLDNILIYSNNLGDHRKQVRLILNKLSDAGLFVKLEKCEFETTKTMFLGFMISEDGISMDPGKVSAVIDWETLTYIWDVQCFLGFANFHSRFIEGLSRTCTPLYNLLKKEEGAKKSKDPAQHWRNLRKTLFLWDLASNDMFQLLKTKFYSAPILKHFNPELETILETDASDYVVSGILS